MDLCRETTRRAVLLGLGGVAGGLALLGNGCVPNVPLPANITADIATTCSWVPTVAVGVQVAAAFLPAAAGLAATAAMNFLTNLCAAPPTDLGGVSQQVINAVQTVESALTQTQLGMSRKLGARRGLNSDYAKVVDALRALRKGKKQWGIR